MSESGQRITRAQRVLLQIAFDLGGKIRVFPDQRADASRLESLGLLTGNGKHFDREAVITDAGRAALRAHAQLARGK